MKNRPNTEGGIPLNSIGQVCTKIQLINYQYFRQLFIKTCSILVHWLYRFDTVKYKIFYTQMRLRHLLLSQWVFAVEKLIGRIVKRYFVVWEHLSGYTEGHCC